MQHILTTELDHKSPLEEKSDRCGGNRERLLPLQLVIIDGLRRRLLGVCLFVCWEKKRKGSAVSDRAGRDFGGLATKQPVSPAAVICPPPQVTL